MQETDILIIGAGPIGLEMAIKLRQAGANYLHLESGQVGQTMLRHWPAGTEFLSAPEDIMLAGVPMGMPNQSRVSVENYRMYLRDLVRQFDLPIRLYERVKHVARDGQGYRVSTQGRNEQSEYHANRIILATGDMAERKRLSIPGGDRPHVRYGYQDVHEFFRQRVLVIGGRNSAVETAIRCQRIGCDVTLVACEPTVPDEHVSHKLGPLLSELAEQGRVRIHSGWRPVEITAEEVLFTECTSDCRPIQDAETMRISTDFVLAQIGFISDLSAVAELNLERTSTGRLTFCPETMETSAPGVYVAGTATAAGEAGHSEFIQTGHDHVHAILQAMKIPTPHSTK
jgi:thioredoxin reductase (NADPH)